jgi:hypothetical protein
MDEEALDRLAIRQLVENWVVWRDAGDWERFRTVWHDDGRMMATWTQGTADEFIAISRAGFDKGVSILHFLGGHSADLKGSRAISQTKMTISQRALVHGVLVDVDPVDPAARLTLDTALLERFPVGYRHLAYLQTQIGFTVKPDMPGLKGSEVEALYARGQAWLEGASLA